MISTSSEEVPGEKHLLVNTLDEGPNMDVAFDTPDTLPTLLTTDTSAITLNTSVFDTVEN